MDGIWQWCCSVVRLGCTVLHLLLTGEHWFLWVTVVLEPMDTAQTGNHGSQHRPWHILICKLMSVISLSGGGTVRCVAHLYWTQSWSFIFIATDTLCMEYLGNNSCNKWPHKTNVFTYFAILDKQQHVINSEIAAFLCFWAFIICLVYVQCFLPWHDFE